MKVLHIGKYLPPSVGGMENSILSICRGLSKKSDLEIVLVGTADSGREHLISGDAEIEMLPLKKWVTLASTPLVSGLKNILRTENPDLIHVHLPNPWITLLLRSWKGPLVATYHCDVTNFPFLKKLYSPVLDSFLNRCQRVIATSSFLSQSSQDLQKFQNKVEIIPLSISPLKINGDSEQKIQNLRNKTKDRMILFVGRLVSYKGLPYLIEAMKKVDGHLVIVGVGPEKEKLSRQVSQLGLSSKISMMGHVSDEDLPSYYKASRVVALPSINESEAFGICLIEALSMARPLVTTNLPTGISYVNQAGVTGLSVPIRDPEMLAEAMSRLLRNENEWQNFSRNALQHFQTNFNIDKIVDSHVELYHRVLNV